MNSRTEDFAKKCKTAKDILKKFPAFAAKEAKNFYVNSWERQGWLDENVTKWQPRKYEDKRKRKKQRAILIKKGDLRRSLRAKVEGNVITVFTNKPYAQVHNEGLQVTGTRSVKETTVKKHKRKGRIITSYEGADLRKKKHSVKEHTRAAHTKSVNFQMPQRQFMDIQGKPMSALLEKHLATHFMRAMDKIFK